MSPNDYQAHKVEPLPEVPQIALSDTTPTALQSLENTHADKASPPVAIKPIDDTQTLPRPTTEPLIVPVVATTNYASTSTFSDILRPAQPASTTSVPTPPSTPAPVFDDIKPTQTTTHQNPATTPGTAPSSNPPSPTEAPIPIQSAPIANPVVKKPRKTAVLIGVIASVVVLTGFTAVVFLLILPSLGKISSSDLVSATSASTSYLYPKQWKEATVDSASGYGEKTSESGDYSALIVSEKLSYLQSGVNKSSDKQVAGIRQLLVELNSARAAEATIMKAGSCDSVKDVRVTESTVKNTNSIGIFKITGICSKEKVRYKVAYYTLLGNDGYARAITLVATESSWKQNEDVFNKMLDSAEQA